MTFLSVFIDKSLFLLVLLFFPTLIVLGANIFQIYKTYNYFFHNFSHFNNTKDKIRNKNQEVLKPKDWISHLILAYLQKESGGLSVIDISIIDDFFQSFRSVSLGIEINTKLLVSTYNIYSQFISCFFSFLYNLYWLYIDFTSVIASV